MEQLFAACIDAIAERGWYVKADFWPQEAVAALRAEALARQRAGAFRPAGVGRGQARVRREIRGDAIAWLEPQDESPAVRAWLATLENLRQAVNASLYLGLFDLEAHFALYPPGTFYRRHLDRFREDDRRTLTVILYLNENWGKENGGALRFYPQETGEGIDILPEGGTLVAFLSDRFWHEVLPARRARLSLTGWFRRR